MVLLVSEEKARKVRLSNGMTDYEGIVEVAKTNADGESEWGGVCKEGFGEEEADVVCKEVTGDGDAEGEVVDKPTFGANEEMRGMLEGVECQGGEKCILECK